MLGRGAGGTLSELTAAPHSSPSCWMSLQVAQPEGESKHCFPWGIRAVPILNRQGSRVSNGVCGYQGREDSKMGIKTIVCSGQRLEPQTKP